MTTLNTAAAVGDDGTTLAPGYRLDEYEFESLLAMGDFRIAYYAWDHRNERNVVIHEYFPRSLSVRGEDKISVTAQSKERFTDFEFGLSEFLLESRLLSQIRSPYLPNVIEYREANGTGYLVSEYDDGRTLAQCLKKDSHSLPEKQITEILNSGLHGLRELHARNLLHTSVNPNNLFIRFHGHPILLGQGLARYRLAQYTKTYTISLRPGYTPLEQYGLNGKIGPWSDLYALGASLYECVAGVRPIDASSRHTSLIKGEEDPLTPAVEIAQGSYSNLLLSNIDWMMKPYFEDRPDSADLMLGVVSFQKQSKNKHAATSLSTSLPSASTAARSDNQITKGISSTTHTNGDNVDKQPTPEIHAAIKDRGHKFYWSLALLLMAFISITAYQIYQHEIGPEIVGSDDASDSIFVPEELAPPANQGKPGVTPGIATENRMITRGSDQQRREFYESVYKEEEVKRRVEQELEALKLVEEAKVQKQEVDRKLAIQQLMDQASQALEDDRLMSPDGGSAFDYFSSVLDLDPGNEAAIDGINDIADSHSEQAIEAISRADPDAASMHLNNLIKVRPDDPRVVGFLRQISDLKADLKLQEIRLELEEKLRIEQQDEFERLAQEKLEQQQKASANENRYAQRIENDDTTNLATANPDNAVAATPNQITSDNQNQSQDSADNLSLSTAATTDTPISPAQIEDVPDAPAVFDRARVINAYARYDRGEYSTELFKVIYDAANANDGRSQYILAEMYAAGRGVEQNFAESTFWLKQSLDYVNKNAQSNQAWAEKAMGVIYEKGWYVDSNPQRAVRWYRSSANKDYSPAQYRLGLAYAKGLGVYKDNSQAEFWLNKALSNGNQEAKKALAKLPGVRN